MHARGKERLRHRLFVLLEAGRGAGTLGAIIEWGLVALIILNVLAFVIESVDAIAARYAMFFLLFEIVSVAIFTAEYGLRIWTAAEDVRVAQYGPVVGRLSYALRPMMAVDFLAIAPAYVALVVPFADLRILRLFRLLRLLKIARFSPALATLMHVIREERRALFGTLILLLCVMSFSGALLYAVEGDAQPDKLGTIPDAMWLALATLTTVGYGDVVPLTPLGKLVASLTMIVGLGLFALPVGIVATGFVNEIHRRDFVVTWGMLARVPLFQGFDARTVGEIMNMLKSRVVPPHSLITARGERADAMFFIVSGEAEAVLPRETVRFGPGDFFGELALLRGTERAATVTALGECRVLTLAADDFATLMRKHPELKRRIEEVADHRLKGAWGAGDIAEAEIAGAGKASPAPDNA